MIFSQRVLCLKPAASDKKLKLINLAGYNNWGLGREPYKKTQEKKTHLQVAGKTEQLVQQ